MSGCPDLFSWRGQHLRVDSVPRLVSGTSEGQRQCHHAWKLNADIVVADDIRGCALLRNKNGFSYHVGEGFNGGSRWSRRTAAGVVLGLLLGLQIPVTFSSQLTGAHAEGSVSELLTSIQVGGNPSQLATCADRLFVVNGKAQAIQAVDVAEGVIEETLQLQSETTQIAVDDLSNSLLVALGRDTANPTFPASLARVDCLSYSVGQAVALRSAPSGRMAFDLNGKLFVPSRDDGSVLVIDPRTLAEISRLELPGVQDLVVVGSVLVATHEDESSKLSVYRLSDLSHVGTHFLSAPTVAVAAKHRRVFLAQPDLGRVEALTFSEDFSTLESVSTMSVQPKPNDLVIHDGRVFASSVDGDSITVLDAMTLQKLEVIAVGDAPSQAVVMDGQLVVANFGAGTVSVVDIRATKFEHRRVIHQVVNESDDNTDTISDAQIAMSDDSKIQVAIWKSCRLTPQTYKCAVFSSNSRDLGLTWSPPSTVWEDATAHSVALRAPTLALSNDGKTALVGVTGYTWVGGPIGGWPLTSGYRKVIRSDDSGSTWGTPTTLAFEDFGSIRCSSELRTGAYCTTLGDLTLEAAGDLSTAVAAWHEGDSQKSVKFSVSRDGGVTWSAVRDLGESARAAGANASGWSQGSLEFPKVALDGSGQTLSISSLARPGGVAFATSPDAGSSWPIQSLVTTVFVFNYFRWKLSETGQRIVAVSVDTSSGPTSRLFFAASSDQGATWTSSRVIDFVDRPSVREVCLEASPDGRHILVAYSAADSGFTTEIRTLMSQDGGETFGNVKTVARSNRSFFSLQCAFEPQSQRFYLGFARPVGSVQLRTIGMEDPEWIPLPYFEPRRVAHLEAMAVSRSAGHVSVVTHTGYNEVVVYQHSSMETRRGASEGSQEQKVDTPAEMLRMSIDFPAKRSTLSLKATATLTKLVKRVRTGAVAAARVELEVRGPNLSLARQRAKAVTQHLKKAGLKVAPRIVQGQGSVRILIQVTST